MFWIRNAVAQVFDGRNPPSTSSTLPIISNSFDKPLSYHSAINRYSAGRCIDKKTWAQNSLMGRVNWNEEYLRPKMHFPFAGYSIYMQYRITLSCDVHIAMWIEYSRAIAVDHDMWNNEPRLQNAFEPRILHQHKKTKSGMTTPELGLSRRGAY